MLQEEFRRLTDKPFTENEFEKIHSEKNRRSRKLRQSGTERIRESKRLFERAACRI